MSLKSLNLINKPKGLYLKHWVAVVDELPICKICSKIIEDGSDCWLSDIDPISVFCCNGCIDYGNIIAKPIPKTHQSGCNDYLVWINLKK